MYRIFPLKSFYSKQQSYLLTELCMQKLIFNTIVRHKYDPHVFVPESRYNIQRPWYKQDEHFYQIFIVNGSQYIELYCPMQKKQISFLLTSNQIYKNNRLYYNCSTILSISKGVYYRLTNGVESTTSLCFIEKSRRVDCFEIDYL